MRSLTVVTIPILALALAACTQTASTPAPMTSGPMDPNSVTTFTLALQPDSVTGCVMGDSSMTRPVKLTITDNRGMLLTDGGIHYSLDRRGPNLYEGGNYIKIVADVSGTPKRLTVRSNDSACKWAATAV